MSVARIPDPGMEATMRAARAAGSCMPIRALGPAMASVVLATLLSGPVYVRESVATQVTVRPACGTCEESDRFVRLQVHPAGMLSQSQEQFTHPVQIGPDDWARILRRIRVQPRLEGFLVGSGKGLITDVFTAEDIQFLSTTLSKAFAEAGSEEVIVFNLSRPRTPDLTEITTGSWFIQGDVLYLVLANYQAAVTLPGIRKLLWDEPLRIQAGVIYDLVPGEHQTVVTGKDHSLDPFDQPRANQIAIQYRSIVRPDRPASASTVTPASGPESHPTLEERLERLKRLREQGLITEEEFAAKKKDLLDRL